MIVNINYHTHSLSLTAFIIALTIVYNKLNPSGALQKFTSNNDKVTFDPYCRKLYTLYTKSNNCYNWTHNLLRNTLDCSMAVRFW